MAIDKEELKRMMAAGIRPPGMPGGKVLGQPQTRQFIVQEPNGELTALPLVMTTLLGDTAMQQLFAFVASQDWFQRLFTNAKRVQERNALHKKKGQHVGDWTLQEMCGHLIDEANEVYLSRTLNETGQMEVVDPDELADVQLVLYAIAIRSGLFLEDLHRRAQLKLETVFEFDDELSKQTIALGVATGEFIPPPVEGAEDSAAKEQPDESTFVAPEKDEQPV